ncbi:Hypothetical predicted protein [Olea europaea subsp. europaea]|uniref:Uncharacterized protein n=1 Tax=Olea europaea subsp. europaea TaxID=158383 RepID=A0A8S0TKQ6_OLEEU|nr:Hypothetical predicted protein [Olea europaea subsp. europaea]
MEEEGIEESNVRFLGGGDGGGGGETRSINGNELDLEPPPWSLMGNVEISQGKRRKMKEVGIEKSSVRLFCGGVGDSGGREIRWVDGSEVDYESPPWSLVGDVEII